MANNPSTLTGYNGQTAAPDASYPHGSARDDVAAGDLTGTPRIAGEINDIFGLQQALLAFADITPSGVPDNVVTSQYMQALAQMSASGDRYADGGAANNYVLSPMPDQVAVESYRDGSRFTFSPGATNTGATITDVAGLGIKDIRDEGGAALTAGAITAGVLAAIRYVLSDDWFVLETGGGVRGDGAKSYRVVSCQLERTFAGSQWAIVDVPGRPPTGVSSVSEVGGELILFLDFVSASEGAVTITPNDELNKRGVRTGATANANSILVSMTAPFDAEIEGSNVVASGFFGAAGGDWNVVVDAPGGTYTFTHASQGEGLAGGTPVMAAITDGTPANPLLETNSGVVVAAADADGFTVHAMSPIAGKCDGSVMETQNVGASTAVWDGTNKLTVTHPPAATRHGTSIVSSFDAYSVAFSGTVSMTEFEVNYMDVAAGVRFSGGSSPTTIHYRRDGDTLSEIEDNTRAKVHRDAVPVDVAKVVAPGPSTLTYRINVLGIFEV